jgi:predicted amidophosphoribosyltransferase
MQLAQNYQVNAAALVPAPQVIGIFDDVLTTGAHFKAAQTVLRQQFPGAQIIGFFIARRVPETSDPDEFDIV